MKFSVSDARGFTLVETLAALCILAFGLMAGAELIALACRAASLARSKESAAIVAENKIVLLTDLHRRDPDAPDLALGNHGPEAVEIRNRAANRILNRYSISWKVSGVADPRPGCLSQARLISVNVCPVDTEGRRHLISWMNKAVTLSTVLIPGFY